MSPEASTDPIRVAIMTVLSGFTRDCQVGLWVELVGPDSDLLRVIEGNMLLYWDVCPLVRNLEGCTMELSGGTRVGASREQPGRWARGSGVVVHQFCCRLGGSQGWA